MDGGLVGLAEEGVVRERRGRRRAGRGVGMGGRGGAGRLAGVGGESAVCLGRRAGAGGRSRNGWRRHGRKRGSIAGGEGGVATSDGAKRSRRFLAWRGREGSDAMVWEELFVRCFRCCSRKVRRCRLGGEGGCGANEGREVHCSIVRTNRNGGRGDGRSGEDVVADALEVRGRLRAGGEKGD